MQDFIFFPEIYFSNYAGQSPTEIIVCFTQIMISWINEY